MSHNQSENHPVNSIVANEAESQLDALFQTVQQRQREKKEQASRKLDSIERLRRHVRTELVPVMEELAAKYSSNGVTLNWNFDDLLNGGRKLLLEIGVWEYSLILRGTAIRDVIGFEKIQCCGSLEGAIASGPMLSINILNADTFREFLCNQIASVVRTTLRTNRSQ